MAARSCSVDLFRTFRSIHPFIGELGGKSLCLSFRLPQLTTCPFPAVLAGASLQSLPGHYHSLRLSPPHRITSPHDVTSIRHYRTLRPDKKTSRNLGVVGITEQECDDFIPLSDSDVKTNVTNNINSCLSAGEHGRLFAVVYIRGMQYKVTNEDILTVKYDFPPKVGERLRLEKVLAVGGKDFTLFGQPLLSRDVVKVEATVVEKTLTPNRVWFMYIKRRGYFNLFKLFREKQTMLVINSIQMAKLAEDEHGEEQLVSALDQ